MKRPSKLVFHDAALCMGCHSCEVACKMENNLPAGVNRVRVVSTGPRVGNGRLVLDQQRVACQQCANAACVKACPSAAISKTEDGIVVVDDSCTGCGACAEACPYDAIQFHPFSNRAEICDLCAPRLEQGVAPFCVQHCMSGALFYGTKQEFESRKKSRVPAGEVKRK